MKRLSIAALALILLGGAPDLAGAGQAGVGQVRAMTRNVYVGADVFRIFDAETPADVPVVVAGIVQTVFDTDFPARAAALAEEIASFKPHLVGLQEVSLIRVQSPGDFLVGNPQPAETVLFDYLEILLDALAARGLDYRATASVENADIELPMLAGFSNGSPLFDDVRLTDRDVILARGDVATSNPLARNFAVNVAFTVGGVDIEFLRGFVAVDAVVTGRSYRFVNTHLETGSPVPQIQAAQAQELIFELAGETRPVILVGDLNSPPDDPLPQAYPQFTAAGFADVWLRRLGAPAPGSTCCHLETLTNVEPTLDQRIDYILVRNDTGFPAFADLGPVRALVVGEETGDRTASGLWPSDHAGVTAKMIIPAPGD